MKVLIHAPDTEALARARASAIRIREVEREAAVRIVATDEGVAAAVETRDGPTDNLLILCASTLHAFALDAPPGVETAPDAGHLMAKLQGRGWAYLRA